MTSHPGGLLFWIMGDSLHGRDQFLRRARRVLAVDERVCFAQRLMVGQPLVSGDRQIDEEAFGDLLRRGGLALSWSNAGGGIGLPRQVDEWLDEGRNVVVPGSRYALERALARYQEALIVIYVHIDHLVEEDPHGGARERTDSIRRRLVGRGPLVESPQYVSLRDERSGSASADRVIRMMQGRRACA